MIFFFHFLFLFFSSLSLNYVVTALIFGQFYFSPCIDSPTPIKRKLAARHLGLFPSLEVSTGKPIETTDDSLLETDEMHYLQKP